MKNPGIAPPTRPLDVTWVTMRHKSGIAVDSFWPGNEIRPESQSCSHAKTSTIRAPVVSEPMHVAGCPARACERAPNRIELGNQAGETAKAKPQINNMKEVTDARYVCVP